MKARIIFFLNILVSLMLTACDDSSSTIRGLNVGDTAAPIFTSGISAVAGENSLSFGYIATATDVDAGQNLTYSISGGSDAGAFTINPDTGELSFITPPDFENPLDSNFDNIYEVEITVSDGVNQVSQIVSITVTDVVGEAPYFTSATTFQVNENTSVTNYTATAIDDDGDALTFSLTGGVDQGAFSIDASSGVLSFNAAPDFENPLDNGANNSYVVDITVTDGTTPVTQTVTAIVSDENDNAPVFTSAVSISVIENTTISGYTATVTDADTGSFFSYSLVGGLDQGAFNINSISGELSFNNAPDFETPADSDANNSYIVDIQASDGVNTATQTVTVNVLNSNDGTPFFTSGNTVNVDENTTITGYTASATDPDGDSLNFNITGGSDGAAFSIDNATGVLSFISARDFENPGDSDLNNIYLVEITVDDGLNSASQTLSVSINNLNDNSPVFTSGLSIDTPENTTITGYTATATDADGDTLIYSISGGFDQGVFSIDAGTGVLSFNAPLDFENPSDSDSNNDYVVSITVSDGVNQASQTITVNIIDVVGPPVFTSGTTISVDENLVFTGYIATATDDEGEALTFSLTGGSEQGFFTIDSNTGVLDFFGGTPDYENPVDSGNDNTYEVEITVTDTSALSDSRLVTVTVLNTNDNNPVFTSGTSISVTENTASSFYTATATDIDGDVLNYSITGGVDQAAFNIDSVSGELTFNSPPDFENPTDSDLNNIYAVDITVDDGLNSTTQPLIVTVNNIIGIPTFTSGTAINVEENNLLTAYTATAIDEDEDFLTFSLTGGSDLGAFTIDEVSGVLSFINPPDFENPADADTNNTYIVEISVTDGVNTDTLILTVTVTDVTSGVPVFTSGTAISVEENNTLTGYTATASDEDVGDILTFSLTGGADQSAFSIDPVSGVLSFVSAPDFESPTDSGSDNTYEVYITVSDGATPVTQAVIVTVTNIQEAPVFTSGTAINVNENSIFTAYMAMATDGDGDTLSFSLTGGSDQSAFTIDSGTGVLSFIAAQDFENPGDSNGDNTFIVDITVTDGISPVMQTVSVTVINVQEAPVFTSATAISVGEGTTVTGYTATATDEEGDTLTFSLSAGADQTAFSIDSGSGVLSFNATPDFENPTDVGLNNTYVVDITVTDGANPVTQTVTVTVTDVQEAPVFTSGTSIVVSENTTVTGYTATATDGDGDILSYSLTGGVDQSAFSIDSGSGVLSFNLAPDFENPSDNGANNTYVVDITVTDGANPVTQTVTVTVTDVQEAPVFTSATAISVGEGTTATGYTAAATDEEGDSLSFSITGGVDQGDLSIDSVTGVLTFNLVTNFDFPVDSDANNTYIVDITVTDGATPVTQTVTVSVTNLSIAPPVFTSGTSSSVSENTTATDYTATATDADGDVLSFSLTGGVDQSTFAIDASSGVLSFNAAPDFENPTDVGLNNTYVVDITVTDGTNPVTQTVTVTVTDVQEAPVFTSGISIAVSENTTTTGYTATATDEEGDTLTFSLSGGADQTAFSIDSGSGVLSFNAAPDFENPTDVGLNNTYVVDITVTDGATPVMQTVTVTVTDGQDAPVFISGNAISVVEGTAATGYTATASDEDGDSLSFSLTGGADQTAFSIDSGSGELSFVITTDFSNPADSDANNTYIVDITVSDGATPVTQTVTVTVLNDQEPPVFTSGTSISVSENSLLTGYTATATDADNDPLIFSLSGGADLSAFSIDAVTGELSFIAAPDFENPGDSNGDNVYVVDISVTDSINPPVTLTLTVTVTDSTASAPVFIISPNLSIVENNTAAGTIVATDEDSQDSSLRFNITGGADQGLFSLSGSEVLTFDTAPDFENPTDTGGDNIYELEITVDDRSNYVSQIFYITVLDELEVNGNAVGIKTIEFDWLAYNGATYYQLLVNPDGASGYTVVPGQENITGITTSIELSVHLTDWVNATYILEAYDGSGKITESSPISITNLLNTTSGYFKSSNNNASDEFGYSVSMSGDGTTLAVGAPFEDSDGSSEANNSASNAGAAYVFIRSGSTWVQEAYIKAGDATANDQFGFSINLSQDGNTLVVGANGESSSAGAAYVFSRSGSTWTEEAKISASNASSNDEFAFSLSLSDDADTLVVGAPFEDSSANGVSTDGTGEADNSASRAGAAYIFNRGGGSWPQQAYVKAGDSSSSDQFGWAVSLSGDGNTLAVGANEEGSEGAVYVFDFSGSWVQQVKLQASDEESNGLDRFGFSISLSDDGNTLVAGAPYEGRERLLLSDLEYGAIYIFSRSGSVWSEDVKIRASNEGDGDLFGFSVSMSGDGNTLVAGANGEASSAGAAYVFTRSGSTWSEINLIKAKNPAGNDEFGFSVSLSDDAGTLAVGAPGEDSNYTGISNDGAGEGNNSNSRAGAVYLY